MKYAERLAKRTTAARGYHSAFITTFAIEYASFEEVMLPQLAAAGATNVIVLADERMSSLALSDGSILPQQLGRDYAMHGPDQPAGVFHPKIVLQLGREGGRAFIGSANATAAGIGGNLEIVTEIACTAEPSPEREFVCAVWEYVRSLADDAPGSVRDGISWAGDRAPWLLATTPRSVVDLVDGSRLGFFARPATNGIADQFAHQIDAPVEQLFVLSPYWDDLAAITDLMDRFGNPPTKVLIDPASHDFPGSGPLPPALRLIDIADWHKGRFKHAKLMVAQTAEHDHVLAGSANCTIAALGRRGFAGTNSEACVYRRVARNDALAELGLSELLMSRTLAQDELPKVPRPAPIPLDRAREHLPGVFEAEHGELRWTPKGGPWSGRLVLINRLGEEIGTLEIASMARSGSRLSARFEGLTNVHFARVDNEQAGSALAPVVQRGALRARRREAASRTVADAAARFVGTDDLQLLLLQAFDELERADAAERVAPTNRSISSKSAAEPATEEPRVLSYAEFVAHKPEARNPAGGESSTTGAHIDGVRALLNRLAGNLSGHAEQTYSASDDWLELGDEDEDTTLSHDIAEQESEAKPPADRVAFVKAVRAYEVAMAGGGNARSVNGTDVLRLRFWLLLILHSARWEGYDRGLPCTIEEFGWPRLVVRILSAFFFGKNAPITRLSMEGGYTDVPVDFLETWVTALWALDIIPATLSHRKGQEAFLKPLPILRQHMLQRMALSQQESQGDVAQRIRGALDQALGSRLRSARLSA